MLTPKAKV